VEKSVNIIVVQELFAVRFLLVALEPPVELITKAVCQRPLVARLALPALALEV
jgi:hypothetical protein